MLMANTTVTACNFSKNVLSKIPAKLAVKFTFITGDQFIKSTVS